MVTRCGGDEDGVERVMVVWQRRGEEWERWRRWWGGAVVGVVSGDDVAAMGGCGGGDGDVVAAVKMATRCGGDEDGVERVTVVWQRRGEEVMTMVWWPEVAERK
nr:hypothetical protein [Tanacetum cinerariifolium]